ncbi:MAG: DegT/DnrJ/EryC1/StrS family aminotransferase [Methanobacterium sp.]|nr:DegT/DnrJ/EryC1/StrS family aminotransferase [Methanobacterium sp.]
MELYFKRPSKETRMAMCEAISRYSSKDKYNLIKSAEEEICNITNHKYAKVVNSGNSAILSVMSSFKGKIMVPDQGGWSGFIKTAHFLGFELVYLPTDWGLIDPKILHNRFQEEHPEALFLTSFAGYTAEQPIREIYDVCNEAGVVLVEDASGALGDEKSRLANGNHSHVIVASTGSPKIVNVGNGGFISTNDRSFFEDKFIFNTLKADPITCAGISIEIGNARKVLSKTISSCQYLKNELENVIHPDKRGINVIIKVKDPKIYSKMLRSQFNVHGGGIISKCPLYNRVLDDAVALEIKNLDINCLKTENLDIILKTVQESGNF